MGTGSGFYEGPDSFDYMHRNMPPKDRAKAKERHYRSMRAQGTAAHLAELLPRLTGQSYDDFDPLGIDEDDNIVMTPDQGWLLYEMALRSLPYCFAAPEGQVDETCQMPDGICHTCAAAGRSLPEQDPLRRSSDSQTGTL